MSGRADLAQVMDPSRGRPKTFVVEVHAAQRTGSDVLDELWGDAAVTSTDDDYLHVVETPGGEVWVDSLDDRFWRFHTLDSATTVRTALHDRIESFRWLDWLWLPTEQVTAVWPGADVLGLTTDFSTSGVTGSHQPVDGLRIRATGRRAGDVVERLSDVDEYRTAVSVEGIQVRAHSDDYATTIDEAVVRDGRFTAANGTFDFHEAIVSSVVNRYQAWVTGIEDLALTWRAAPTGGAAPSGGVVGVKFSQPRDDLDDLVEGIFSSRAPFRLWGVPIDRGDWIHVDAVDLHVGQALSFQFFPTGVQITLTAGACGNTIARFISNLQHKVDGGISLSDHHLQSLLSGSVAAAA